MTQERYNQSRERNDRISALMGQYMLKGYCMLNSVCDVCGNVLLKLRDQEDYCVACKEVDVESRSAATTQAVGSHHAGTENTSQPQQHTEAVSATSPASQNAISIAVQAVNDKMLWASQALSVSHSTGDCQQLCELLKTCAETLRALQEIQQ